MHCRRVQGSSLLLSSPQESPYPAMWSSHFTLLPLLWWTLHGPAPLPACSLPLKGDLAPTQMCCQEDFGCWSELICSGLADVQGSCRDSSALGALLTTAEEPAWKNAQLLLFSAFAISIPRAAQTPLLLCGSKLAGGPLRKWKRV